MNNYFDKLLVDNPDLASIFKEGVEDDAIQTFDPSLLSKLRRLYYSSISAILYILGEPNIPSTFSNKIQLLVAGLSDQDYTIVHGRTRTSMNSEMQDVSWVEVVKNNKVWVYDVISMLKFEKEYFKFLESPIETKRVPKDVIEAHPAHLDNNFKFEYIPMIIVWFLSRYEDNHENPYYRPLRAEIKKYKKDINYDKAIKDYHEEAASFTVLHDSDL